MRRLLSATGLSLAVLASAAVALGCTDGEDSAPGGDAGVTGPSRLSETGLYSNYRARTLADGVISFSPIHPLWADGAEKARFFKLPDGSTIDTRDMDHWQFPVGTKAWKEFRVDGRLVETRLLWKKRPDPGIESWWRVAYVWNDDGSDAIARVDGAPSALGTTHDVPSQEDCGYCHIFVRDGLIGLSAIELAQTGLLPTLAARGLLSSPPTSEFVVPGEGVVRDALAYLHGNCGFCHNERMEELIKRTIRFQLKSTDQTPEQTGVYTTTFHAKMRHVMEGGIDEAIVPGDPDRSQAYRRMIAPGLERMPPKGTKMVDEAGSAIVREWILGLPP
jgi:hypothetical protein